MKDIFGRRAKATRCQYTKSVLSFYFSCLWSLCSVICQRDVIEARGEMGFLFFLRITNSYGSLCVLRICSFSPTDQKLASCSDDGTVRIWDFVRCQEEKILRGNFDTSPVFFFHVS